MDGGTRPRAAGPASVVLGEAGGSSVVYLLGPGAGNAYDGLAGPTDLVLDFTDRQSHAIAASLFESGERFVAKLLGGAAKEASKLRVGFALLRVELGQLGQVGAAGSEKQELTPDLDEAERGRADR